LWPVFLFHNGLNIPDQKVSLVNSMFSTIQWDLKSGAKFVKRFALAGLITNVNAAISRPHDFKIIMQQNISVMTWGNFYNSSIEVQ
jgi:hypothetical protein